MIAASPTSRSKLPPSATLHGTVYDAAGEPAAGVRVSLGQAMRGLHGAWQPVVDVNATAPRVAARGYNYPAMALRIALNADCFGSIASRAWRDAHHTHPGIMPSPGA